MHLDIYITKVDRGRPLWFETLWLLLQTIFVSSWIPGSTHRVWLLRLFGASIGKGVNIKPRIRVKFPWRLRIGHYSWIGEDAWIDNLAEVDIGDHCCISQGVYLCTGSHDWSCEGFDLISKPIILKDHTWVAARSIIGPGVTVEEGAILALGSTATRDLRPWWIHQGVPAIPIKARIVSYQQTSS